MLCFFARRMFRQGDSIITPSTPFFGWLDRLQQFVRSDGECSFTCADLRLRRLPSPNVGNIIDVVATLVINLHDNSSHEENRSQPSHCNIERSLRMDDHTLQEELEALAGNAYNPAEDSESKPEPMKTTVARWQKLFNLPQDTAVDAIMEHRNNLTRTRVSDTLWETVRPERESQGYDREAYQYELDLQKRKAALPDITPAANESPSTMSYLVELSGPFTSAEIIQQAAKLKSLPPVVSGENVEDGRPVSLCCVDGTAKAHILQWASTEGGGFEPTILLDLRSLP